MRPSSPPPDVVPEAENHASASRAAFARLVRETPDGRTFGQVHVVALPEGAPDGFELRHVADRGVPSEGLAVHEDPREAREISKLTEEGEYRPLKSSPNLRRGWLLRVPNEAGLGVAMNYLYPAGLVHWHLRREGRLEVTHYRENAARQSGIYKRVQRLSDTGVTNAALACCEDAVCLKARLWDVDEETPLDEGRGTGAIPCPEPCSVFVSFARRVRLFEREERRLEPGELTESEKEDLISFVETGANGRGRLELAREAEFEEPFNERRMRYRELTLLPKLRPHEDAPEG